MLLMAPKASLYSIYTMSIVKTFHRGPSPFLPTPYVGTAKVGFSSFLFPE